MHVRRPAAMRKMMKPAGPWRLVPAWSHARNARPFIRQTTRAHVMNKLTLSVLVAIASSAAVTSVLAQDAAAGKTSFNKCLPCHRDRRRRKNKVGPELNGLTDRKSGTRPTTVIPTRTRIRHHLSKDQFLEYIKDRRPRFPAQDDLCGIRTRPKPTISGPTSPPSTRTARRVDGRRSNRRHSRGAAMSSNCRVK